MYGVVSRGIEIVHNRYWLSKRLLEDCVQYFSKDPPDTSNIHIKEGNFARAFPDGTKTGVPDFKMRNFLLFNGLNGLPESERKGLVVFINNVSIFSCNIFFHDQYLQSISSFQMFLNLG